jgi:hypothetical protein
MFKCLYGLFIYLAALIRLKSTDWASVMLIGEFAFLLTMGGTEALLSLRKSAAVSADDVEFGNEEAATWKKKLPLLTINTNRLK